MGNGLYVVVSFGRCMRPNLENFTSYEREKYNLSNLATISIFRCRCGAYGAFSEVDYTPALTKQLIDETKLVG